MIIMNVKDTYIVGVVCRVMSACEYGVIDNRQSD